MFYRLGYLHSISYFIHGRLFYYLAARLPICLGTPLTCTRSHARFTVFYVQSSRYIPGI
jgi:hypothetical protein